MTRLLAACSLIAAASALALPASAQSDADAPTDWELVRMPEKKTLAAVAAFDNGLGLVARCTDGVYDVMITGLPEAARRDSSRQLGFRVGDDGELVERAWTVARERTAAFSRAPAPLVRQLAKGGKLQIVVPGENGGRRTRYVMELGASAAALEETLTTCDRPLVDPRDSQIEGDGRDGLPAGVSWAIAPRPSFPVGVNGQSPSEGYVSLTCVTLSDGRLNGCQIEAEQPPGFFLGRSTLRAMDRARVQVSEEARAAGMTPEGRVILFTVVFKME